MRFCDGYSGSSSPASKDDLLSVWISSNEMGAIPAR